VRVVLYDDESIAGDGDVRLQLRKEIINLRFCTCKTTLKPVCLAYSDPVVCRLF
jgi:hypothetical protein